MTLGQPPPHPKHVFGRRKVLRALWISLVPVALGAFFYLSFSFRGRQLTSQTLELFGVWPQAIREPDLVIAHRLTDAKNDEPIVPGWYSLERRVIKPGTDEARKLAGLFDDGKLTQNDHQLVQCLFEGDFALEFVRGVTKRTVAFDFDCPNTLGDASIHGYDRMAVGAFAESLFPDDHVFNEVAKGLPARPVPEE